MQYVGDPKSNSFLPIPLRMLWESVEDCIHPNEVAATVLPERSTSRWPSCRCSSLKGTVHYECPIPIPLRLRDNAHGTKHAPAVSILIVLAVAMPILAGVFALLIAMTYFEVQSLPVMSDVTRFVESFDGREEPPTEKIEFSCNRLDLGCWQGISHADFSGSPLFPPFRDTGVMLRDERHCPALIQQERPQQTYANETRRSLHVDRLWDVF